ncbi:winged helix-turn-helix transcriptional regulator [Candidatus Woesearchaeota archaeon]|nr:winged helix-turn-helix transcriptional regulator [Candidatus Woesearchaeota archaeon]
MLKERLGVDDKDIKILTFFMKDPFISQNEIAEKLKLSQPSINARIQKLKTKGVLNFDTGMSFSKTNLFLSRVDFTATNPNSTLEFLRKCAFFVNGFVISGKNNVSVFFINESLQKADEIINEYLRTNATISDINVSFVVSATNDFLFKIDLETIATDKCYKLNSCAECKKVGGNDKRKELLHMEHRDNFV